MTEVSIIVPVYQVEQYLKPCIESILAQTFSDFELILVDDGSKDGSGEICDAYAGKDPRIRVIHKKNGGAADARNYGMEQASGRYFMFVDGDDILAPTMIECLYHRILDTNADISACNFLYDFGENSEQNFSTSIQSEIIPAAEIFYNRKNDQSYGFWTVVWNKLYHRQTFEHLRFRSGKYYEDEFWANDLYQMQIQVATTHECLYYYRQRADSVMHNDNLKRNVDLLEALRERIAVYLEEGYDAQAYLVLLYSLEYLTRMKRLISCENDKIIFLQSKQQIKDIIHVLKKKKLSTIQQLSLIPIEMNPCLMFSMGMKFRGLLERFL